MYTLSVSRANINYPCKTKELAAVAGLVPGKLSHLKTHFVSEKAAVVLK